MKYDVSILVPVYNVERFIERCLHSLFGQTYPNIQFVFVDDCSPDHSLEIIQKVLLQYPERKDHVRIIKHEKNRGLAVARNTGIENAEGEYILHIDSDDYIEKDMVSLMFSKAQEDNSEIVICDFAIEWKKTQKIAFQKFTNQKQYLCDLLNTTAMPGVVNKLIKRQLYTRYNIQPFEGINLGEDYVTTPRLVYKAKRMSKVNKALYHYIQFNDGSYTAVMTDESIADLWFVLQKLYSYFKETDDFYDLKDDILKGQLIKKIDVITRVENDKRKEIFNQFSESNSVFSTTKLSFLQKITYRLCFNDQYQVLNVFLIFYKKFFNAVQILKRRK